jgi:enamine deaminase RidA (YjgF/YER057c/UK114 family)
VVGPVTPPGDEGPGSAVVGPVTPGAEGSGSPHRVVNPADLSPPSGFSHAVVAAPGRTVYLGGQTAHGPDGSLQGETVVEQFDAAAANVVRALSAVWAGPEHLVSMHIYVTDATAYRHALGRLGPIYRRHFGRHYPAIALFEVTGLFDPRARVELVCVAMIPSLDGERPSLPR